MAPARKAARKPAGKALVGRPFDLGRDSRRATGDALKHGGRPPDAFKAFLRGLRDHPIFRKRLRAMALKDPNVDRFLRFAEWLVERTDGRPVTPLKHVPDDGLDALREMPNERFLAYVRQLEAEIAEAS